MQTLHLLWTLTKKFSGITALVREQLPETQLQENYCCVTSYNFCLMIYFTGMDDCIQQKRSKKEG